MKNQKLLLTILMLFFCSISVSAQQLSRHKASSVIHKAHVNPEAGQAWWGYYDTEEATTSFGTGEAGTYNCAIFIPSDLDVAKDAKVYAERLYFAKKAYVTDLKIWLSKSLPKTAEEADVVCKSVEYFKGGVVDFAFDEPYQISGSGVYVGYSFTIEQASGYASDDENEDNGWPMYCTSSSKQNAAFFKVEGWRNWYSNIQIDSWDGQAYPIGNIAMQVLLGDHFYNNAACIKNIGTGVVAVGKEVNVPVTIQNVGGNSLLDFTYTVTINGQESEEIEYSANEHPILGLYGEQIYDIPLPAAETQGENLVGIKITKVNFEPNELNDGTAAMDADIITVAKRPNRKTVMENFLNTTDDGYCVLSWLANDRLGRDWHDELVYPIPCRGNHKNYIGIQIHDRDAFSTNLYIKRLLELDEYKDQTRFPFIFSDVDRENTVLQFFGSQYFDEYNRRTKFGVEDDFGVSQDKTVEAEVQVSTTWGNSDKSLIRTTVTTTFQYDTDKDHYALAFALVEDGKIGNLNNSVLPMLKTAGLFDYDPLVNEYVTGPSLIQDATFNDVLVAVDEIYEGIPGSIQTPIKCGEEQYYLHKWDLSYVDVDNRDNLKVIAMLIDTNTGRIVNANRARIGEDSADEDIDGINVVKTTTGVSGTYDLMGRRVGDSYKGIVIKDGKKFLK